MSEKKIALVLQGGGALNAFSWGVADRILEDQRIKLMHLTGGGLGGLLVALISQGLIKGHPHIARQEIKSFFQDLTKIYKDLNPYHKNPLDRFFHKVSTHSSPGIAVYDYLSRVFSPYELNPFHIDPIKQLIHEHFHPEHFKSIKSHDLFLYMTHIQSGEQIKIDLASRHLLDALLASVTVPSLQHAVSIDKQDYWEGNSNPTIQGITDAPILYVNVLPIKRKETPLTPRDISNRCYEISTHRALISELGSYSHPVYTISIPENNYPWSSKMNFDAEFILKLFDKGRMQADKWIKETLESL